MKNFFTLLLLLSVVFSNGARCAANANTQSRETWRSVRTNHLQVIGNAEPDKLRQVATWLELFHVAFARLVSRNVLDSSTPTTVIIFRDDASFRPFKPLYQGRPANIAGFFQPGDDVNYIALSLDPDGRDPFSTAFHEYVHLHLKDNVPGAPLWLNEGLAELYGSLQFSANDALLGAPLYGYLQLLRNQELLPLKTLFSIGTDSPHYNEQDKSGIFYGQSWALVHYLMLGDRNRQEQFGRFLQLVSRGDDTAKAIESSFGITLTALEEGLRSYISRGNISAQRIANIGNLQAYTSYTATQRSSLTAGEAQYYLGDLMLHIGRHNDAERYFKQAVALDPDFAPSYAALGQYYVYQRRYDEAKKYLQKATRSPQSYLIHYLYAYVLSREGISSDGVISDYSRDNAALMRDQLLQSIKLSPAYAPAHFLLALVDFITGERLEEALEMAQKAHDLAPSNSNYSSLLERIKERGANGHLAGGPRLSVSSETLTEPPPSGSARMLGGDSSGGAIRDGRTIEKSSSLPSVEEVLSKYVEALGGAEALKAINSRVIKGTVDVVGVSRGGSFETDSQAPNKMVTVIDAHPVGAVKVGFNGRTGWTRSKSGLRILKNPELSAVQRQADFYIVLTPKNGYSKISLEGMSKIGYRDVYVVDLQPASGTTERLYLDATTYLPVRVNRVESLGTISAPVEIYLDDWREVDGIKYPFSMSQSFPGLTFTFTVKEIRHNVPIDAKVFEP